MKGLRLVFHHSGDGRAHLRETHKRDAESLVPKVDDAQILALWSAGKDTFDIARALGVHESVIANRLPRLIHRRDARGVAA